MRKPLLSSLAGPAILFAIVVGFFWKLTLTNQYTWTDGPDFAYQVLPWLDFQAREWHSLRFPLWDPYLWGGQSLIGQMQPAAAYPLNWPLFWLPLRHGHIRLEFLHWYWVLIHYLGALFCYWLCRDLQLSRVAALLAGAAFGLGGYIGTTEWPQMLNGAIWAPLVLLFFLRTIRGERPASSAALSGACLGFAFLGGHHQGPIFISVIMAGLWIWALFHKKYPLLQRVRLAAIFLVLAVLVSALQTIPAYEYGKRAVRWVGSPNDPLSWDQPVPYNVHADYSLGATSLLGIVIPGISHAFNPFIGVVAVSLALLGFAREWGRREVRLVGAIGGGGILLALGGHSVFHGVAYSLIPLVEKARSPSAAILLFHFAVCVLIAFGYDALRARPESKTMYCTLAALSAVLFLILLVAPKSFPDDRVAVTALAGLLLAALLLFLRREQIGVPAAGVMLMILLLLELGNASSYFQRLDAPDSRLRGFREHVDLANFLRQQPGLYRVDVEEQDVPYNFGDWFGIDQFGGYVASVPENVYRAPYDQRTRLLSVAYRIARKPAHADERELFTGTSGLKVYFVPNANPRVWIQPDPACADAGVVQSMARSTNTWNITVEMKCPGMVVIGDAWFPGWQARVDGRAAAVVEVNGLVRGVRADAGHHDIRMRYRPRSVLWGGICTALGLLAAALSCMTRRAARPGPA